MNLGKVTDRRRDKPKEEDLILFYRLNEYGEYEQMICSFEDIAQFVVDYIKDPTRHYTLREAAKLNCGYCNDDYPVYWEKGYIHIPGEPEYKEKVECQSSNLWDIISERLC